MDEKHGIFKNEVENRYEAWDRGYKIGSISCHCSERTIIIWYDRYSEYLGVPAESLHKK